MTEKNTLKKTETAGEMLARHEAYAGKPGQQYVSAFVPAWGGDACWLAEAIDDGEIIACPRCHFLNLPALPFPVNTVCTWPATVDPCQVCMHAYGADDFGFLLESKMLNEAEDGLARAREARADTLYDLWMGPSLAADLWAMAEMGRASRRVKALSRGGV